MAYRGSDVHSVAIHKFSSCDGCQLAFLNAGEDLLALADLVQIRHFAEAGIADPEAQADIAFVEGSISTQDDLVRIQTIRTNSKFLITIGACATSGGLQALRNMNDSDEWVSSLYATPAYIDSLSTSTPVSDHVKVDFELWGCPVNGMQVMRVVRDLLFGVSPVDERDKVCLECKRQGAVCVLVTRGAPCMGPVTRTGCGAICPRQGRDCYACYGPAENINADSLGIRLEGLGLVDSQIANRFLLINSNAKEFARAGKKWSGVDDEG